MRNKYAQLAKENAERSQQEKKKALEALSEKQVLLLNTIRMLPHANQLRSLPEESRQLLSEIPRAPPALGKNLFVSEMYKRNPQPPANFEQGASALRTLMGNWKALPDAQKLAYEQKAQALWKDYENRLANFLK